MKAKLAILAVLLTVIVSCQHKPKNRVTARFEAYLQSENLTKNLETIDSVIPVDSVNLSAVFGRYVQMKDSVHTALMDEVTFLTENMGRFNQNDFPGLLDIAVKLSDVNRDNKEKDVKEKISIFLEDLPENKAWYKKYRIVASFKDGQRTFYANDVAFEDTIAICDKESDCETRKLQRINGYLAEYLVSVYAPEAVLLDKAKALHDKTKSSLATTKSRANTKKSVNSGSQRKFLHEFLD